VLSAFRKLPKGGLGLSLVKTYLQHRCDLRSIGYARETDPDAYRFDNNNRGHGWLFQYTLDGEGRFYDGDAGQEHVVKPGTGFLCPLTSNTGYWLAPGREWEFVYIIFSGEQADYHARRLQQSRGYLHTLPVRGGPVKVLYDFYKATTSGEQPDEFLASAALYRFLMEFHSMRRAAPERVPKELERVRRYVKAHYGESDLGIERLAAVAGYSRFHFTRLFKKHVGLAPYAYLLRFRLRRAMERISSSTDPIKRIALEVGFNDYAYFCNIFKKYAGSTPAGMRKNLRDAGVTEVRVF